MSTSITDPASLVSTSITDISNVDMSGNVPTTTTIIDASNHNSDVSGNTIPTNITPPATSNTAPASTSGSLTASGYASFTGNTDVIGNVNAIGSTVIADRVVTKNITGNLGSNGTVTITNLVLPVMTLPLGAGTIGQIALCMSSNQSPILYVFNGSTWQPICYTTN